MAGVGAICTAVAIYFSTRELSKDLEQALVEKSRAILSRLEQSATYVAQMNTLKGVVAETVKNYRYGALPIV